MSDNVIKFRPIEKKPEPQPQREPGVPGWVPWVGLVVLAMLVYGLQQAGVLGA